MKRLWVVAMLLIIGFPSVNFADDTDIYGVAEVSLKPNVLIVFDKSGSMDTEDVPGALYDPDTDYSSYGPYEKNTVYQRWWFWWFEVTEIDNVGCETIKNRLLTQGYSVEGSLGSSPGYNCQGTNRDYRLGNYRNYLDSNLGDPQKRLDVAKQVITELVQDEGSDLNLGLMIFPSNNTKYDSDGGELIVPIDPDQDNSATIINAVNAVDADGWTPLAETLAEAGLYFAGKPGWFMNTSYTSPIDLRCRKNYIIIMTDGEPTQDRNWRLETGTYIHDDTIGDYDGDGHEVGDGYADRSNGYIYWWDDTDTSDYLDDVAKYLHDNDLSSLGSVGDFEKQNLTIFTIGFKTEQQLLQDTAENSGGDYYTASNYSDLKEAFESIFAAIAETNEVFVAPVVPVSEANRAFAGDKLFIGFFQPKINGVWWGNIKKFGLDEDGEIIDADGNPATDVNGVFRDTSRSYWSSAPDGSDVSKGGLGEVLLNRDLVTMPRNIYTYTGTYSGGSLGGTKTQLSDSENAFASGNTLINNTALDVATDADRQSIIDGVHNGYTDDTGTLWRFGDVIHAKPGVVFYDLDDDPDIDKTVIFTATNWGTIGAFDDETGQELWAFIPPDQLSRLKQLTDSNTAHDYFIDAQPVIYNGTSQTVLLFGERRGGSYYHALNITDYDDPYWMYDIGPNFLGGGDAALGQSWVAPELETIMTASGSEEVFILAGGYDINQDLHLSSRIPTPDEPYRAATDTVGRAIFAVNVTTGSLSSLNVNAANSPDLGMTHCIIDVTSFDHDDDGITSRIYAGDLGGNLFAIRDDIDDPIGEVDGTWVAAKLFTASADGVQRKIFYSPDVSKYPDGGEIIFFGTGDRADPRETSTVNRFYAIKNDWTDTSIFGPSGTPLDESDLYDATDNLIQVGTSEEQALAREALNDSKGWFIRLENPGEKIVSSPLVFGKVVYFTTYEPDPEGGQIDPDDPCKGNLDRGVARLYAVDYVTGASVFNFYPGNDIEGEQLGKEDRNLTIGTSIPSPPTLAIFRSGPKIFIGIGGGGGSSGIFSAPMPEIPDMDLFYWRQIY